MLYIKYRGGNPPASITEHVHYEDPEQPCFRGRDEARILVHTRCEDERIPRGQWDARFYAHIQHTPYEGMQHCGGIGLANEESLRPFDEVITQAEYEELKRLITAANEEYKKRCSDSLVAQNDPGRRALREDEALGWRTRVRIASCTELSHHVPYYVDESCRAYLRVREYVPNGMTIQLIDLYHRTEGDVLQAAFDGAERVNRFIDLLALAGFGPALLLQTIGTSPSVCREGVPFRVATLQAFIVNSAVPVSPESFEDIRVTEATHLSLRLVREGLSASLPTAALASFWNALERQADDEARATGAKRTVRCRKCGDEREVGWDTKKGFEAMYAMAGVDADFDRHRALRGRIQHGDAFFSGSSPSDFMLEVSRLQLAAIASVSKRVGLLPQTGVYMLTGIPAVVFECMVQGDNVMVNTDKFEVGAAASILPMRASANRRRVFHAGIELPPKIDPLILPPIERDPSPPVR